jgi:hypothetical protein
MEIITQINPLILDRLGVLIERNSYEGYTIITNLPGCRVCRLINDVPCGCFNATTASFKNMNCGCSPGVETPIVLVRDTNEAGAA